MVTAIDFGPTSGLAFGEFATALAFSLAASIVVYVFYHYTYGNQIGAGVNRTFLLGGPAITTLFIAIQFSLPLSLGLLGALSFVRFRTPRSFARPTGPKLAASPPADSSRSQWSRKLICFRLHDHHRRCQGPR